MLRAGRALDALDLLPAPFPLEEILPPRDLRQVQLLYGIGGLSYGNVSARYTGGDLPGVPDPGGPVYWMSASGVDKADLRMIGEHILLVRGYDAARDVDGAQRPAGREAEARVGRRDRALDDLPRASRGRRDPARARLDRRHRLHRRQLSVRHGAARVGGGRPRAGRARIPSRAVVGLRNHGLTITGHSLDEIFDRVGDDIVPRVPMSVAPRDTSTLEGGRRA